MLAKLPFTYQLWCDGVDAVNFSERKEPHASASQGLLEICHHHMY